MLTASKIPLPTFSHEERYWLRDMEVAGVDEVGVGALAGPVVAAACVIPVSAAIPEIRESKQLTPKKRERLYNILIDQVSYSFSLVHEYEIDQINIHKATMKAMRKAIEALKVKTIVDAVIIDGNVVPEEIGVECEAIVKGDETSISIAAASVIAKVLRDRIMTIYDKTYPEYGFKKNKGYGSKDHMEAIRKFGPCAVHRMSYNPIKQLS